MSAIANQLTADLIARMSQHAPRYTSYPTADRFGGQFCATDYIDAVRRVRDAGALRPLSLLPISASRITFHCSASSIRALSEAFAC